MKSTKRDIAENYLRSREMKLVSWTNSTKFHEKWKKKEKFEEIFKHTDFRYAHKIKFPKLNVSKSIDWKFHEKPSKKVRTN